MTRSLRTSFSFAEWPERDRTYWEAGTRKGEIFEPDGRAAQRVSGLMCTADRVHAS